MTVNELREKFNKEYGFSKPWPSTYEVDADTYAQVVHHIIKNDPMGDDYVRVYIGPNDGIMFKNVELILEILPE